MFGDNRKGAEAQRGGSKGLDDSFHACCEHGNLEAQARERSVRVALTSVTGSRGAGVRGEDAMARPRGVGGSSSEGGDCQCAQYVLRVSG